MRKGVELVKFVFDKACLGKSNLTLEQANRIIDRAARNEKLLLYFYKCEFCNSYHITKRESDVEQHLMVI